MSRLVMPFTKIVITGNKGGTGKTTIAALLAEYLNHLNKKSLPKERQKRVYFLPNRYQKTKEQKEGLQQLNETRRDMKAGVILSPLSQRPALYELIRKGLQAYQNGQIKLEKQLANLQLQEEKKQEQQALQIQQSFGYAEAEKWIELGLEPEDVYFADWLVEEKGCTPERSTKEYIKKLNISDNDFSAQDLSVFRKTQDSCWSLKKLIIGNNRFYGNLEPLEKLVDLELLDIKHTDIEGGIEYLPESIKFLFCDFKKSEENELSKIYQELELFPLQEENKQLQEQKTDLKKQIQVKNEELVIERETNRESAELMDNFYRKNPPREDLVLKNILCGISNDYLETNRENKQLRKEIQELEKNLETVEKLLELHDQEQQTAQILQPTNQPYGTPGSNKK
ncbi:16486_t:CDS:2 [Entrophospora sp. SA101]|nr:16486_t:CDS:2 [Entrophospora sp. SA101]